MNTAKPEFVVFYAWQSDRPGNRNRYLIQEAATDAATRINDDPASPYIVRIDQDTLGVPGLCDIPATILEKIDSADAFLCDLTYVATSVREGDGDDVCEPRYCSNPNVLFELGYAFRSMGYERVLCVMNEHYGPVTSQIFDIKHRRFPLAYSLSPDSSSRREVKTQLSKQFEEAIRAVFSQGTRAAGSHVDRVPEIRRSFESRVRGGNFHRLIRRAGAITISIIPAAGMRIEPEILQRQLVPPPSQGRNVGWNPEVRASSVISPKEIRGERCGVTELRDDGVVLASDTFVLDPSFHPNKERVVASSTMESLLFVSTQRFLETLRKLSAPLPWTICISLLEVRDYWLFASNVDASRKPFPDSDIVADPIVVRNADEADDLQTVRRLLRPAIDFIWREFGFPSCWHYDSNGEYRDDR